MILRGAAALERLARESALALHDVSFAPLERSMTIFADGTRLDDEAQKPDTGLPELDKLLSASRAVVVRPGCRRYTFEFADVITSTMHDESSHEPEPDEDFSTPLRHYTSSRFLSYLAEETFADALRETPLSHFRLATLDTIIDVAVTEPPKVTSRVLTASDLWSDGA